jgi:hypothetical protein
VVVGPGGVFAIETKARPKRHQEWTVTSDGNVLHFPRWQEREPLEQARRQAGELRKFLTSAIGEPVDVTPVVALPGWRVERSGRSDVLVINPKNPTFLAEPRGGRQLTTQTIERIAHQLEQRCRDVEPLAFPDRRSGP